MHSEYLRGLFLENRLAQGQFTVAGRPIALTDIKTPIFCMGTEQDHVSPWKSVYKLGLLTDTDITFLLASGGHNGGILSAPGESVPRESHRHDRAARRTESNGYISAEDWRSATLQSAGSWWPTWSAWLRRLSGPGVSPSNASFPALSKAPGRYVFG